MMGAIWKYRIVVLLKRFSKVVLAIVVLAWCLLVNCTVVSLVMFGDRPSFEEGISKYEGVPSSASDINIFKNENFTGMFLVDFAISEDDFVGFAEEMGWVLEGISGRENIFVAKLYFEEAENPRRAITSGYYFSDRAPNGGGITVAFDRNSGRGYISSSNR